ncbi:hypothetical protein SAMD00019534_055510 [Acytostelium subglobosum LB1]|uniref:hypothetical protein n=1 Tax=Acytostelium subglobosum LB1 TaxID=1410327 RepID=UPI00064517E3|nr:hypothetical protein SAMD00019534_055510 [Acytostelium subglobosum LB1]GAM22376.1 hypothetical protein SAMD00019534_055510 [Acytostelium subglobosum LB1]|eukprot:XP_012754496.1 hypothetical protein SAMD00019534_055510 [Acytostelium subglobosum LB1]
MSSPSLKTHLQQEQDDEEFGNNDNNNTKPSMTGSGQQVVQPRLINLGNGLMLPKFDPSKVVLRSSATGQRDRPVSVSNPEMLYALNNKFKNNMSNSTPNSPDKPNQSTSTEDKTTEELMSDKLKRFTSANRHSMMPTMTPPLSKEKTVPAPTNLSTTTIILKDSPDHTARESPEQPLSLAKIDEHESESENVATDKSKSSHSDKEDESTHTDDSSSGGVFKQQHPSKKTRASVYRSGIHRLSCNFSSADLLHAPSTQEEDNINNETTSSSTTVDHQNKTLHMSLNEVKTKKKDKSRIKKILRLFLRRRPSQKDLEKTNVLAEPSDNKKSKKGSSAPVSAPATVAPVDTATTVASE